MVVHAPKSKPLMQSYWFHPECNSVLALKILLAAFSRSNVVTATFLYEYHLSLQYLLVTCLS